LRRCESAASIAFTVAFCQQHRIGQHPAVERRSRMGRIRSGWPTSLRTARITPRLWKSPAGRHVLCEKPLATNFAEADEMTKAASDARVVAMVNLTYRNVTAFRRRGSLSHPEQSGRQACRGLLLAESAGGEELGRLAHRAQALALAQVAWIAWGVRRHRLPHPGFRVLRRGFGDRECDVPAKGPSEGSPTTR
jgi:hypothetical protein